MILLLFEFPIRGVVPSWAGWLRPDSVTVFPRENLGVEDGEGPRLAVLLSAAPGTFAFPPTRLTTKYASCLINSCL